MKHVTENEKNKMARFHLPGLFEFYTFYKMFLPLYEMHREWFYEWIEISSVYGAPEKCIWSGGRLGQGDYEAREVLTFFHSYGISARLAFSNSLLEEKHLSDEKCNVLCQLFDEKNDIPNGVIVHSELLLEYLQKHYPHLYFVSSTTKVLTRFEDFFTELNRSEIRFIVPDFRFNMQFEQMNTLSDDEKRKVEFLCNECCYIGCTDRKNCYESVSKSVLGETDKEHICNAPDAKEGYLFSKAMKSPAFISREDILNRYLPSGFTNFKIEGRNLGSALLLEFLLYYLVKPEYHLEMREKLYLDSMLDLF